MRTKTIPTRPPWTLIVLALLAVLVVGMLAYSVMDAMVNPAQEGLERLR